MNPVKFMILEPTLAGYFVRACYGLALEDMARDKAAEIPGAVLIKAATEQGAGATLTRMPAGHKVVA